MFWWKNYGAAVTSCLLHAQPHRTQKIKELISWACKHEVSTGLFSFSFSLSVWPAETKERELIWPDNKIKKKETEDRWMSKDYWRL